MFGHVRLKPDTMVACNRQIGSLLNVMYPPPYGRQRVTAWWPAHVEHPTNGRWTGSRPGFRFDSGCAA
nr:MAG TPA: hypothetical protein [Caudoviricetes sp.]